MKSIVFYALEKKITILGGPSHKVSHPPVCLPGRTCFTGQKVLSMDNGGEIEAQVLEL